MNDEELHHQAITIYSKGLNNLKDLSEYIKDFTESHELNDDSIEFIEHLCSDISKMMMQSIKDINTHAEALGLETIDI